MDLDQINLRAHFLESQARDDEQGVRLELSRMSPDDRRRVLQQMDHINDMSRCYNKALPDIRLDYDSSGPVDFHLLPKAERDRHNLELASDLVVETEQGNSKALAEKLDRLDLEDRIDVLDGIVRLNSARRLADPSLPKLWGGYPELFRQEERQEYNPFRYVLGRYDDTLVYRSPEDAP